VGGGLVPLRCEKGITLAIIASPSVLSHVADRRGVAKGLKGYQRHTRLKEY
jgi:hypothetical protein